MSKKYTIILIFILSIFLYMLFSTKFINNKVICNYDHFLYKDVLSIEIPGNYKLFNPSICRYKEGYIMCVRYSNKIVKNIFLYMYSNIDYQSHICFVILDKNMKILKTIFPFMDSKFLEDPRICYYNDMFFVSVTEFINKKRIFPSLYVFNNNFTFIKKIEYNWDDYFYYTKQTPSMIQKNFCPFEIGNKLLVHTDTFPTWNVSEMSVVNNTFKNILMYDTREFFKDSEHVLIRCSTSWKNFGSDTLICGLHTKKFTIGTFLPIIRTILVIIDKETLKPIKKTKVLCFDYINDTRIQFLSGLETDDLYVYLTFGIGDYKTIVKRLTKKHVEKILYSF